MRKPVVLIVMDGFGLRDEKEGNAIATANTPNLDKLFKEGLLSKLKAHGEAVGLPTGYQGSSEVGHLNIGAGRVVYQTQVLISKSIETEEFFGNKAFLKAINNVKKNKSHLHIMGLLQDQGVHAHQNHLFALLKMCTEHRVKPFIHVFTDGRDTLPKSTSVYLEALEEQMKKYPAQIKTIIGRYYAMDRDNRWDRINEAFKALESAESKNKVKNWREAINFAYEKGETDEFIKPIIIGDYDGISEKDSIIFLNYRGDRARQITKAFTEPKFNEFKRKKNDITYVCMAEYYKDVPALIAFKRPNMKNILSEYLSKNNKKALHAAETEKYAHVTFFFNGEIEKPFLGEDRILIPSPKVATYDLQPEMSAAKITTAVLKAMDEKEYDFIIMNYANCDMVGHTGIFKAAVKAVETVDECIGKIVKKVFEKKGVLLITGDHGNAEEMGIGGKIITSHSTNLVPLCVLGTKFTKLKDGKLGDIAPTILKIMGMQIPKEMTGKVLIS